MDHITNWSTINSSLTLNESAIHIKLYSRNKDLVMHYKELLFTSLKYILDLSRLLNNL